MTIAERFQYCGYCGNPVTDMGRSLNCGFCRDLGQIFCGRACVTRHMAKTHSEIREAMDVPDDPRAKFVECPNCHHTGPCQCDRCPSCHYGLGKQANARVTKIAGYCILNEKRKPIGQLAFETTPFLAHQTFACCEGMSIGEQHEKGYSAVWCALTIAMPDVTQVVDYTSEA